MNNIGFVESNDTDKASVVKSMVEESKVLEAKGGLSEGSYVRFDNEYGRVVEFIFKGGVRISSEEVVLVAKLDDPVVIVKQYSQNEGIIVPTNRRVIKNVSSLEKVNAINKSDVKEVSKMDSEIIIVDEIEKSMSGEVIEEAEKALPFMEEDSDASAKKSDMGDEEDVEKSVEVEVKKEGHNEDDEEEMKDKKEKSVEPEMKKAEEAEEVSKAVGQINEALLSALSTLADTVKALDTKIDGINKAVAGISTEVEEVKDKFGKRVDAVEKDTAFRKSADLGEILQEQPVIVEKSTWGGRFLNNVDLFK